MKDIFNKQEQEGRAKYISLIAESMTDDDIEILTYLYKICRQQNRNNNKYVINAEKYTSIQMLMDKTHKTRYNVWHVISRLELSRFVDKHSCGTIKRRGSSMAYTITAEGVDALNHLLNDKLFPRYKTKIDTILEGN